MTDNIQDRIIKLAKKSKSFKISDIVTRLRVSRQYGSRVIAAMIAKGELIKAGEHNQTHYALPNNVKFLGQHIARKFVNGNLAEHEVLNEITRDAPYIYSGNDNARSIFDYAFSEMLNNAIEHSISEKINIDVNTLDGSVTFHIRDFGIGVFRNVMSKRKLQSEMDAALELLKGKITTAPQAHSGEGIFFTSKIADIFILESYDLRLKVDNTIGDIFLEEVKPSQKGTSVIFQINKNSKKHLSQIFEQFQTDPSEYAFDKTEYKVKLYTLGTIYVSRSQARRLMSGLDKFKKIVLDFEDVPTVGQGFADEIFRVFKLQHPKIELEPINMNKTVEFMVGRVAKK